MRSLRNTKLLSADGMQIFSLLKQVVLIEPLGIKGLMHKFFHERCVTVNCKLLIYSHIHILDQYVRSEYICYIDY